MKVVIAGAGMGGLAAAIRLQSAGIATILLDRNARAGGKLNLIEDAGYRFDTGPSLVTMPEVFEELFATAGMSLHDELDLVRLDPYCRYFFDDGTMLETSDSMEKMSRALLQLSPLDVEAFFNFLGKAASWYRMSVDAVIYGPPLDWRTLPQSEFAPMEFFRARPFQKLDSMITKMFRDERIRRIARLIALYTGCAPNRAPAIFSLIPFLEFGLGRWYVQGGLYEIARKLLERYKAIGGDYRPSSTVTAIDFEGGRARRARVSDGSVVEGDAFVVNADVAVAAQTILSGAPGAKRLSKRLSSLRSSTSAFVLMIGARLPASEIIHHNISFSADEQAEWDEVFEQGRPPSDPTVYLNNPSYTDPSLAPSGSAALFAMVNVPARTEWDWDEYQSLVISTLERRLRPSWSIDVVHRRTPQDFADLTFAENGSLYGKAPDSLGAMMKRPKNVEPGFDGVYFVGGTTHPGAGIPLAALSGKLVANLISGVRRP
jgi:phytoene desaturase